MTPSLRPATLKEYNAARKNLALPFDMDGRIVLLAAVTAFINVYLCMSVALLAAVYALADRERRRSIMQLPHVRWLALFAIPAFISPMITGNWVGLAVTLAVAVILVFYLYLCTVMNEGLFNAVIDLAMLISLVYMAVALFQRLLGGSVRSPSTFQNANYFSYALELVIVMSFYRLSTTQSTGQRLFIWAAILANIFALWTADCRSAWPSVFGGLFVLFVMNRKPRNLLILILSFVALAWLAINFPAISPRLGSVETAEMTRSGIWLEALGGILLHPVLGVGAMGYLHLTTGKYMHSHNLFLEMLISFGVVGTFMLGAFFILSLRDCLKRYRRNSFREVHALVIAAAMVTAIHGMTDVTVMWPQTGMLLVLILAGGGIALKPLPSSSPFSA